eukprot:gene20073-26066_t
MIQRRLLIAVQPLNIQRRERVANNKAITMFTNLSDKKSSQSIGTNGNTGLTTAATVKRRKIVKAPVEEIQSDLPLELRLMLQSEERLNSASSNNNSNSSTILELNSNTDAVEPPTKQMRLSINASSRGRGRGRGIKSTIPISKQTIATDVLESRIIELLQRRKYVDQQEISDYAIMPAREARERLYKLYRDNWLNYIEFSKRNDYNPASTYYYWYIDNERSTKSLLDNMYKTILNLRIRRENELERYRNMEISSGVNLLNSSSSDINNSISIVSMTKSLDLLDSSILRLDKTILLLNKF